VGDATLPDLKGMLKSGYETLSYVNKLPDFEDLYWDVFQKTWTDKTSATGPIEYQWEDLEAAEAPYAETDSWDRSSRTHTLSYWKSDGSLGGEKDPNNYDNASDWINAHDSVYNATWDLVEFFIGKVDPETRYSPSNNGKAVVDLANDKDEI
jgi:hypothetical protein